MKISKFTVGTIIVWGLVNIGLVAVIPSYDDEDKTEIILTPDIISKFDSLHTQVVSAKSNALINLQARLLKPDRIEESKKYPLVVSLHGAGERGSDNQQQLKYLPQQMTTDPWRETYACFLLAPQCPSNMNWSSSAILADSSEEKDQNLLDQIHKMILDVTSKYPIDKRRVYITGYSMGGFGTWDMIARYPDTFAAAVPVCGGGNPKTVSRFFEMPIWVVHGDADQIIPVSASRDMVDALQKAGGCPIYKELRGVTHNSWTHAYTYQSDMLTWLFKQEKK
ncbi:carboxylesterase family protein [Gimesia aquarii]|uniref:Esterase n=1 Tax=Gimesia aquarii TaxID=2527964 RepID=A0A517VU30_9PLAN|nr:prolyl oligopeptidase family serine peptidase [Gimesia aquarii]QDT96523.1 esterase [Gimesia aquarii]